SAVPSSALRSRAMSATRAPSRAKAPAIALPNPLLAPVITATRPFSLPLIYFFLRYCIRSPRQQPASAIGSVPGSVLGGKLSGFGGFGRKKRRSSGASAPRAARQDASGAPAEMTTEASGRSTASVDAAKREIPVGLRQLNPGTGNSWRAGTKMMLTGTWEQLAGVIVQGRYRLRTLLYSGRRQAEYLATVVSPNSGTSSDPGATRVSVTLMNLEPPEAERQLAEIARARKLEHPNLLRVLDGGTCSIEGAELVYVVTEVPQNTLAQALEVGPLPQAALSDLLHDIIAGLEYVHAQNLVYRLDPQGIVRAESRWKLADPSQVHAAGEFSAEEAAVPGPTRAVPPEAAEGKILPAWDVWALGVMLEDAAGGPSSRGAALPQPYEAVVRACREADPARRISLAEIRRRLDPEPPAAIRSPRLPAPPQRALPVPASRRHRWIAPVAACFVLFGVALVWMKGRQQQEIAQQTTTAPPPPQPVP